MTHKRTIVTVAEYMTVDKWSDVLTHAALEKEAQSIQAQWLLAHADDGLFWGRITKGRLIVPEVIEDVATADPIMPEYKFDIAKLNETTLQQLWLFGPVSEAFLWRSEHGWQIRRITNQQRPDGSTSLTQAINEDYLLYGTQSEKTKQGFTVVRDGQQGLRYAFPDVLTLDTKETERRLKLKVRHYLSTTDDGFVSIGASRLVTLEIKPNAK